MDDYRAIVIERTDGSWRVGGFPDVLYRKGNKFRRDTAIWLAPSILADPKINWPKGGKDADAWWSKCIEDRCFLLPMSLDLGSTAYTFDHRCVTDADGSTHYEIVRVNKRVERERPGETYRRFGRGRRSFRVVRH